MPPKKSAKKAATPGKSIREYEKKRDFSRTREPLPAEVSAADGAKKPVFIVHRHEARRLHYDLRMEQEGVLICFAIPKGLPYETGLKHMAVHTEDHPLAYLEFSGTIPRGEYGGGTMTIFDEGTYSLLRGENLRSALEEGEIKIFLHGHRVLGEWHLIRTGSEKGEWLIFKAKDRYARKNGGINSAWDKIRHLPPVPEEETFPDLPELSSLPIGDSEIPGCFYEPVIPGKRLFLRIINGRPDQPEMELAGLRCEQALLEGILTRIGSDGLPLAGDKENGETVFYARDLLEYQNKDIRSLNLRERKSLLSEIIPDRERILFLDHMTGSGGLLLQSAAAMGLPGITGRPENSPVSPHAMEFFVAAGSQPKQSGRRASGVGLPFTFSNPEKIFWPEQNITKGDLLSYYDSICDVILPYLKNRPVHLLRYPDGINGEFFYQKQLPGRKPSFIRETVVREKNGEQIRYLLCEDRHSLLYFVNLGCIDLHPWLSSLDTPDSPDLVFIDLDPKRAPFSAVLRIAREAGRLLRGIGVRPYVKTSGKTGMHIAIPLIPGYSYEQGRLFCESICRILVRTLPEIATVERSTKERGEKVYLDFLQNRREQTIVPPYVPRPVPAATVSMPLTWDEVNSDIRMDMFTLKNSLQRTGETGDLFRGALEDRQDLAAVLPALQDMIENL